MLFEANPHPMWVFDRHTLGFLAVNDAAVESYGYTRDEFLGMTVKDIRPEEDVPALLESLSRPSLHKTSQTANSTHRCLAGPGKGGVWRHRKKDGTVIDVEITAHDVVFGGRARGLTDGGRRSQ
jgi:PAS domain S-box-containing protein